MTLAMKRTGRGREEGERGGITAVSKWGRERGRKKRGERGGDREMGRGREKEGDRGDWGSVLPIASQQFEREKREEGGIFAEKKPGQANIVGGGERGEKEKIARFRPWGNSKQAKCAAASGKKGRKKKR